MNTLPNFFCVGTQKAGTSTLFNILRQHPQIYLPEQKETHFFYSDHNYSSGLNWYHSNFYSDVTKEKIIGDFTPEYMFWENVPKRIHDSLGTDLKFLFVLRHPVDRAYSHYLMTQRRGLEKYDFQDAILLEPKRIAKGLFERNTYSYLSRSQYFQQIENFTKYFPRDCFHFIIFETELKINIETTITHLLNFFELPIDKNICCNIHSNKASGSRFEWISRQLWTNKWLKEAARLVIPQKENRSRIFRTIELLNLKKKSNKHKLNPIVRKKLFDLYFREECKLLEKIINYF